jgi:hypothetical protein
MASMLIVSFAHLLCPLMSNDRADQLQRHLNVALQAVDIINDLCTQPLAQRDWSFSEEHCCLTTLLRCAFTCFAGERLGSR